MKKSNIFLWMAVMPFMMSCEEVIQPGDDNGDDKPAVETVDLRIGAENTKVHLEDDIKVVWDSGDKVFINGMEYEVVPDSENPSFATVHDVERAESYTAFYSVYSWPYENNGYYDYNHLGSTYNYMENSFANGHVMVAYSTSENLVFQNLDGVLKVGITGNGERLKSVTLSGGGNERLYGQRRIAASDIIAGNFNDTEWANSSDYETTITLDLEEYNVFLGNDATWFYFSLPPMVLENGFTINAVDDNNGIFSKSTASRVEITRSRITQIENTIEFVPAQGLSMEVAETTHNSITVELKGEPKASVNVGAVYSLYYDLMVKENGGDITEGEIIDNMVLYYGSPVILDGQGFARYTITSTETSDIARQLAADKNYKVFAGYAAGDVAANSTIQDTRTAVPSGAGPGLDVPDDRILFNSAEHKVYASGAVHASYCYMSAAEYKETLEFASSDEAIFMFFTSPVTEQDMQQLKSTGLWTMYDDYGFGLIPDSDYIFFVTVTAEGGVEEHRKIEFTTPKYIQDDWQYEILSEEATSYLSSYFYSEEQYIDGLTLKKVVDQDIFLLENPFPRMASPADNSFTISGGASEWIVIDAREAEAVRIERNVSYVVLCTNMIRRKNCAYPICAVEKVPEYIILLQRG